MDVGAWVRGWTVRLFVALIVNPLLAAARWLGKCMRALGSLGFRYGQRSLRRVAVSYF
jgi:hypothetical protein